MISWAVFITSGRDILLQGMKTEGKEESQSGILRNSGSGRFFIFHSPCFLFTLLFSYLSTYLPSVYNRTVLDGVSFFLGGTSSRSASTLSLSQSNGQVAGSSCQRPHLTSPLFCAFFVLWVSTYLESSVVYDGVF